jgi:FkbM family methyltransferase
MRKLANLINPVLGYAGFGLVRTATLRELNERISTEDADFIANLPIGQIPDVLKWWKASKSQFGQDLFALASLGFKRDGFFVDFGATDGKEGSNSWLMEKEFGWKGIVAEPARSWHPALRANRDCVIETRCVFPKSGETVEFSEYDASPALSTILAYADGDYMRSKRTHGRTYRVDTISLNDMLESHGAPAHIDYLSADTEGSEFDILAALDFDRHQFGVITCEHNHTPVRQKIFDLLVSNGYRRVLEKYSDVDDWYVRA